MRLLNSKTLELEEFNDGFIPPYAILSHTWEAGEEVTLGEMQLLSQWRSHGRGDERGPVVGLADWRLSQILERSGYVKIRRFCETAAQDGFAYGWMDTCCIDKTSSSELSEAINSMYRWYQRAEVCYAYLSDVAWALDEGDPHLVLRPSLTRKAFVASKWFTRGWTLQELIAPSSVIFFNRGWKELGTKSSLNKAICEVTGIQVEMLLGADLEDFSVAQRMSWASRRKTTRLEDQTYCLMGLFNVNMPMLYGEGRRAFIRLQEEIIRNSDDGSILAWPANLSVFRRLADQQRYEIERGVLASSPAAFAKSGNIIRSEGFPMSIGLTNRGVHLLVEPIPDADRAKLLESESLFMSVLNCEELGSPNQLVAITLKRVSKDIFKRHSDRRKEKDGSWLTVRKPMTSENQAPKVQPKYQEDAYIPQKHHQEKSFPYEGLSFEIKDWQGSTETYPQDWFGLDGLVGSVARAHGFKNEVAGLRFNARSDEDEDFVVILEIRVGNVLSANVFMLHWSKNLEDTVLEFANNKKVMGCASAGPSDRVTMQYGHRSISVVIKRMMFGDVKGHFVKISFSDLS